MKNEDGSEGLSATQLNSLKTDKRLLDKDWRMSHLYWIQNKDGEKIRFKPNRAQADFHKNKHLRNVIVKSRQLGFTTFESIDMLDDVLFGQKGKPGKRIQALMRAHLDVLAEDIFQNKINFAWQNLDENLKKLWKVSTDRAKMLKFEFGDGTFSSIAVKGSGRSGTHQRAHISEYAKLCKNDPERADEVITGTFNSVPTFDGRIDIESTAEGDYGNFYEIYMQAKKNGEPKMATDFKAHFYNWTWDDEDIARVPERDMEVFLSDSKNNPEFIAIQKQYDFTARQITYYYLKWLAMQKNWSRLRSEYPITDEEAFVSSGTKEFDQEALSKQVIIPPIRKDSDWEIFEEYERGRIYVMGSDVAQGVGQDSSTAVVLKLGIVPKVVATFANNRIDPAHLAHELKRMAINYGGCLVAPERNNHGYTTISKLLEIYPNVYSAPNDSAEMEYLGSNQPTMKYGFLTTRASKPFIISNLKQAINSQEIEICSQALYEELRSYDSNDLSQIQFDPKATKHWDLMIALAISYFIMPNAKQMQFERPIYHLNGRGGKSQRPTYFDK